VEGLAGYDLRTGQELSGGQSTAYVVIGGGQVALTLGATHLAGKSPGGSGTVGSKIDRNAFRAEREAFWKAEAKNNPGKYGADDMAKMQRGRPATGPDGYPMELHHVDRTPEGGVVPMSRTDHRLGDNYKKNHP
jgi:hypothetical protein